MVLAIVPFLEQKIYKKLLNLCNQTRFWVSQNTSSTKMLKESADLMARTFPAPNGLTTMSDRPEAGYAFVAS